MDNILKPEDLNNLKVESLLELIPEIFKRIKRVPKALSFLQILSQTSCTPYKEDFRPPFKPNSPEETQNIVLPSELVTVTNVLLKENFMCKINSVILLEFGIFILRVEEVSFIEFVFLVTSSYTLYSFTISTSTLPA